MITKTVRTYQGPFWTSKSVSYTPDICPLPRKPRLADRYYSALSAINSDGNPHIAQGAPLLNDPAMLVTPSQRAALKSSARHYADPAKRVGRAAHVPAQLNTERSFRLFCLGRVVAGPAGYLP
jgi:hypothetical protein